MAITYRKLSDFLEENLIKVNIDNTKEYKCGGIRLNGRGIFVRETKLGADIQKQWVMHSVEKDNVVYSTLFADKGAFSIATEEDEDLVFSEKFICFRITSKDVLPEYLHVVFQTDFLSSQCNEFKTGMAAFSLSHSSKKKVLKLSIPVPDIPKQLEIIKEFADYEKRLSSLDGKTEELKSLSELLRRKFVEEKLNMAEQIRLSELGEYKNRPLALTPGQQYKQITVKLHGNGVVLRKLEDGANIKSNQFIVEENDLVYSKIDVKSGAIGFVPANLSNGIVTADFPVVVMPKLTDIDRKFLMIYFSSEQFCEKMQEKSKGTTNRVRTKKKAFLDNYVPWGDAEFRSSIVECYYRLCNLTDKMAIMGSSLQNDIPALTSKYLSNLLGI